MSNNYLGIYQAIVSKTNDPEKRGRIKVKCPEVLGKSVESAWCEPCVNVARDKQGDMCIPPKKEAVWIMFIGGDSNYPVYLGGWWSKNKSPLGSAYDVACRVISYDGVELQMKKSELKIKADKTEVIKISKGAVTITGDVDIKGNLKVNGLAFSTHTHTAPMGETSTPH